MGFISHERQLKIVSTDVTKVKPSEVFPEIALPREFLLVFPSGKNLNNTTWNKKLAKFLLRELSQTRFMKKNCEIQNNYRRS